MTRICKGVIYTAHRMAPNASLQVVPSFGNLLYDDNSTERQTIILVCNPTRFYSGRFGRHTGH
jgi:hypothetical protein